MFVTKHFLASESAVNNAFSITVASDYSVYNTLKLMTHTQCFFLLLLMMQILLVMHLIVWVYADIEGIIRECSKRT